MCSTDLFLTEERDERVRFLGGSRGAGAGSGAAGCGEGTAAAADVRGSRPPAAPASTTTITTNKHPIITVARYARGTFADVLQAGSRLAVCARGDVHFCCGNAQPPHYDESAGFHCGPRAALTLRCAAPPAAAVRKEFRRTAPERSIIL